MSGGGSGDSSPGAADGLMPSAPNISGGVPSTLQVTFDTAWTMVINALANPACDSVYSTTLGSLPLTTAQLWATLQNAAYVYGTCPQGPTVLVCTSNKSQTVTFNKDNPIIPTFNGRTPVSYPKIGKGQHDFDGANALEFALLHELGHLEGILLPADANKYNNPFNKGILTNCMVNAKSNEPCRRLASQSSPCWRPSPALARARLKLEAASPRLPK